MPASRGRIATDYVMGEVRQASRARLIRSREEHFPVQPFERTPLADMPLKRATHTVGKALGMVFLQFAQQGDRLELWRTAQQWDDFGLPYIGKCIRTRAPVAPGLLRRKPGFTFDTSRRSLAHARLTRRLGLHPVAKRLLDMPGSPGHHAEALAFLDPLSTFTSSDAWEAARHRGARDGH